MLTYGFFNSLNNDRKYNAEQMAYIIDALVNDGVMQNYGEYFATKPGDGMSVVVEKGMAWFDSTWTRNDGQIVLDIDPADVTLTRYDAIVLEVDRSVAVRANKIKVVKGVAASSPAKPTMVKSANLNQYPLAYVKVEPGVTSISTSAIEIRVGQSDCPWITGILQTVPIDSLFAQWDGQFNTWFDNLQAMLDDNIVTNLQNQISSLQTEVEGIGEKVEMLMGNKCSVSVKFMCGEEEAFGIPITITQTNQKFLKYDGRISFLIDPSQYTSITINATATLDVTIDSSNTSKNITIVENGNITVTIEVVKKTEIVEITTSKNSLMVSSLVKEAKILICGSGGAPAYGTVEIPYSGIYSGVSMGGAAGYYKIITLNPATSNGELGSVTLGAAVNAKYSSYNRPPNYDSGVVGQTTTFTGKDGTVYTANGGPAGFFKLEKASFESNTSYTMDIAETNGLSGGSGVGGCYARLWLGGTSPNRYITSWSGYAGQSGHKGSNGQGYNNVNVTGGTGQGAVPAPFNDLDILGSGYVSIRFGGYIHLDDDTVRTFKVVNAKSVSLAGPGSGCNGDSNSVSSYNNTSKRGGCFIHLTF